VHASEIGRDNAYAAIARHRAATGTAATAATAATATAAAGAAAAAADNAPMSD